jgi:diaminopimelate epimerase
MLVNDVNTVNVEEIATQIQQSELLPNQANVGFMQVLNANEINLRVYERGAGETLACGSGACAAVISGVRAGLLDSTVVAHLRGGDALIEYTENEHVFLSGPAQFVYEGQVEI